jgi:serine/threonine protein phosphatase PrpC
MKAAIRTDVGKVREHNEDRAFADPELGLFVVADGVGGHQGGEVASNLATEMIVSSLKGALSDEERPGETDRLIWTAIRTAHEMIWARAGEDPTLSGMSTTVVLALCRPDRLHIAHVGDSRAYLIHGDAMRQLTEDHSVAAEMIRAGRLTPSAARRHRARHLITRCLGSPDSAEPELLSLPWSRGSYLLLCSDGLTDMVHDEEIKEVVLSGGAQVQASCERLVDIANTHGGADNITVVLALNE